MCVLHCIALIVAEYMSVNASNKPSEKVMENIFDVTNTDDEGRAGFLKMLPCWVRSTTSVMELMGMMEQESDEETSETE